MAGGKSIATTDYAVAALLIYMEQAKLPVGEYRHLMNWVQPHSGAGRVEENHVHLTKKLPLVLSAAQSA